MKAKKITDHKFIDELMENEENRGRFWAIADLSQGRFIRHLFTDLDSAERACSELCSDWDRELSEKIQKIEDSIKDLDPEADEKLINEIKKRVSEFRHDFDHLDCRYHVLEPGEEISNYLAKLDGGIDIAGLD